MKKTKKRILVLFNVAMVIALASFLLAGCEPLEHARESSSSNSDHGYEIESNQPEDSSSQYDRDVTLRVCAQQSVEAYLSKVEYPWDSDEWRIKDNYDGSTSISTQVTLDGSSEKQLMTVILTLKDDGVSFTTHYVSVGGTVYLDEIPE